MHNASVFCYFECICICAWMCMNACVALLVWLTDLPSCFPGQSSSRCLAHTPAAVTFQDTLTHSVYTLRCPYTSSGFSPLSWVTRLTSMNMKIIKGHSIPGLNFIFTTVPELRLTIVSPEYWLQELFSVEQLAELMNSHILKCFALLCVSEKIKVHNRFFGHFGAAQQAKKALICGWTISQMNLIVHLFLHNV